MSKEKKKRLVVDKRREKRLVYIYGGRVLSTWSARIEISNIIRY